MRVRANIRLRRDRGQSRTPAPFRCRQLTWAIAGAAGACFVNAPGALAQESEGQLEEITVTARFREESLQQTPIAVSAFSAENLEARGITEIQNLGEMVPNAFIRPSGTTPFIGIRGKINGEVFANFEPTTALYIDGTYWGRQVGTNFDLFDIERVEVLRGPQGTLFGKNALAGAIRIITKQPQGDNSGFVELTYGDYEQIELRGGFDIPLSDSVYLRATGFSKKQDGYIDRLDWACQMKREGTPELAGYGDGWAADGAAGGALDGMPDSVAPGSPADMVFAFPERSETQKDETGHEDGCTFGTFRGTDVQGGRIQLRYVGTNALDAVLSVDVTDTDSDAFGAVMYQAPSNLTALDEAYIMGKIFPAYGLTPDTFTGGTADPRDGAFWRSPESYSTFETLDDPIHDQDFDKGAQVRNMGVSLNVVKDLSDTMSLTYIGSYRELESDFSGRSGTTQGDSTPFDYIHNFDTFDHQQTQHELRLSGLALDSRLDWTVGAFYFQSEDQNHVNVEVEPLTFLGIFPTKIHRDRFDNSNQSVFIHGVYNLTERIALTAGARQTREERDYDVNQLGILVLNEPIFTSASRTDWKLGIDYSLTDGLIYASAATGFRSEGFQPRPWTPSQVLPFDQEEVLSYEVGYKGDFFDNRLRMNVAAFYEDYDPRVIAVSATQCNEFDAEEPGPAFFDEDLVNTGEGLLCPPGTPMAGTTGFNFTPYISSPGKVKGVELELTATPVDNLTLTYTYGYNQFRTNTSDPEDIAYRHPDALLQPETNMSASIEYDFYFANGARLSPRLDVTYQGHDTVGDPSVAPTDENIIPSYTLYNARLAYVTASGNWDADLSVRNLTDEFYWYSFASPTGGGFAVPGSPGAPRMWSMSVRRRF